MGQTLHSELLSDTLSEVLEDAAFIFTESADDTLQWHSDVVESTITYEGQENGVLALAVDHEMAKIFAANLLGIDADEPDADAKSNEALAEMLNIVCGVFLEKWLGTNNQCRLGLPKINAITASDEAKMVLLSKCNAILEDEDGNRIDIYVR